MRTDEHIALESKRICDNSLVSVDKFMLFWVIYKKHVLDIKRKKLNILNCEIFKDFIRYIGYIMFDIGIIEYGLKIYDKRPQKDLSVEKIHF